MSLPLLSIIIPYYNLEQWLLKRCIDSIISQLFGITGYEIIIIDDGSSISVENFIKSYNNRNLIYVRQDNKGLSGARNTGVKMARGRYIQFVDSDDYIFKDTLRICMDLLKKHTPDLLNFNLKYCYKKEEEFIRQPILNYQMYSTGAEYMSTHYLSGSACLYIFKKSVIIDNNLLFTEGIFHEDEEFTTCLYFFSSKIISVNLIVYAYYQRDESITNKTSQEHLEIRFRHLKGILKRLQDFYQQHKYNSTELQQKALERKINFLVCDYIISMVRNGYPFPLIYEDLTALEKMGLYPLAPKKYSYKYTFFRLITSWKLGIRLIYIIDFLRIKK